MKSSDARVRLVDDPADADAVAAVAAATFALACPPGTSDEDVADFVGKNLTPEHWRTHIGALESDVLLAQDESGKPVGYSLVHHTNPTDPEVAQVVTQRPVSEISKLYVVADAHGSGISAALMEAATDRARARGSVAVWLGVSNVNERAQRFYAKCGFTQVGRKSFWLNGDEQRDYVLSRPIVTTTIDASNRG